MPIGKRFNCSFVEEQLKVGGQLIDVRSPFEFNQGALSGAVNMPINNFRNHQDDIDKNRPVMLYCRTGARSEMVEKHLERSGFDEVYNIGGIMQFVGCLS